MMDLPFSVPPPRPSGLSILEFDLKVITPILGGGVWARQLDNVDVIRTQTIRGHLRFWWRALTEDAASPKELYEREKAIWGGTGQAGKDKDATARSKVIVTVSGVSTDCGQDPSDLKPGDHGSYALWPARAPKGTGEDPAPRWKPGVKFHLRLTFPVASEVEIKKAISAWLCFGGYGSRTRRGLGKIAPDCDISRLLVPNAATAEELSRLLGEELFSTSQQSHTDWPRLRGVQIGFGKPNGKGETAWEMGLNWLRDFRQGAPPGDRMGFHSPGHARVGGAKNRPSISNWPEADKVRRLSPGTWEHTPNHNAESVLPRAALGLPIVAQFQRSDRNKNHVQEPGEFELRWQDGQGNVHDRLGSPLIVGAMPLADNKFVPFALWLGRGYPQDAKVVVIQHGRPLPGSEAKFDDLVAPGDLPRFNPLAVGQVAEAGTRMRTAFFNWLTTHHSNITVITEGGNGS